MDHGLRVSHEAPSDLAIPCVLLHCMDYYTCSCAHAWSMTVIITRDVYSLFALIFLCSRPRQRASPPTRALAAGTTR